MSGRVPYSANSTKFVSMGPFNPSSLPSKEFLLGANMTTMNGSLPSNAQGNVPAVKIESYYDDTEDADEQMDVDDSNGFPSKYKLKLKWGKSTRHDNKPISPSLYSSEYSSKLPVIPPHLLNKDLSRLLEAPASGAKDGKAQSPPVDFHRWQATIIYNPAYKLVRKASKCLTTSDWNTAIQELVLTRAFERIEELRNANQWSFRQPKRQVIPHPKDHWAYLLDEAVSHVTFGPLVRF
jgi:chromatin modification-related protein VID21